MIRRLALCLSLLPGLAIARPAHPPAAPPPPVAIPMTPPAQCEAAIARAEADANLPSRVLSAIALRESGRVDPDTGKVRPWPWTINVEGVGHFYDTKDDAIAAVQAFQASGAQSIDVGCMQVNLVFHPNAFASLDDAFDPARNAEYAGHFLKALFASFGDWGLAIAAYHSRTPGVGEPYRDQVVATWNPKDPAVLAKLTFQPLPAVSPSVPDFGAAFSGGPAVYAPFAQPGPVRIAPNLAYRAFLPETSVYRAFRPASATYADFAQRPLRPARNRPVDLRLNLGLSGRALVVPTGVVVHIPPKPAPIKQAIRRTGETG